MRNLIIVVTLILSSCSAEWHLQRAIKKGIQTQLDTIVLLDTVITKEVFHDTTIITNPIDTITIYKDQWHVKIIRVNDTLQINGGCKADTLFIERIINSEKVVNKVDFGRGMANLLKWLAVLMAFLFAFYIYFKVFK